MLAPLASLEQHALLAPDALAVLAPTFALNFVQLRDAAAGSASRLRDSGVRAGDLVALDLPSGLEWVLDLALMHVGAVGVSVRGVQDRRGIQPDHVLTEEGVDATWFAPTSTDALAVGFPGPESIFRYLFTNGTTGVPRAAAYSLRALDHRISSGAVHWTDGRRELTLMSLSTTGGFHAAAGCLRYGIPFLAVDRIDGATLRLAEQHGIEVLCGSPNQLSTVLNVLQAEGISLPDLQEARLAGAVPSWDLLERLERQLGVRVHNVYGSTEGGGVCQIRYVPGSDRYDVGAPLPQVELQVLDGTGQPARSGTEGTIRYRTLGQVSGYLVDGVVEPLPGGWFVPGDRGRLTDDGHVVLTGRHSELLNLGGVKIDPARIDELAAGFPGVSDVAAFGIERRPGTPEVALAVVSEPTCDLRALDRRLRELLPAAHPTAYWRLDAIPRSRLGKPMRAQLADDYDRLVVRRP
jgi:acyl-coenzyme A synthetase/AMP-(fatty) acid ligase